VNRYECHHCLECPDEKDWNNNSHYHDDTLLLPKGLGGGVFDCPNCGEVVNGEDLTEV
jgi:hypothetical protein